MVNKPMVTAHTHNSASCKLQHRAIAELTERKVPGFWGGGRGWGRVERGPRTRSRRSAAPSPSRRSAWPAQSAGRKALGTCIYTRAEVGCGQGNDERDTVWWGN